MGNAPPDWDAESRLRKRTLANFVRADQVAISPVDWLIEDWITKDCLAGLVGPSGSCKSFLAVDWACRVATGTPWSGHDVGQGAVFYLAGEGQAGLRKRIEGWSTHSGVSIDAAPLYLAASLPVMADQLNAAVVISEIEALADSSGMAPALIIVDTLARAMAGHNENSAEHMGNLIVCIDRLRQSWPGATVLMVHHTGHEASGRARGSSSFYAALDAEVVLARTGADGVTATVTKAKDWSPAPPMHLKRHSVDIALSGISDQSSTLVLVDGGPIEVEPGKRDEVRTLFKQGKKVRAIAEATGVSKSTVSRWLNGPRPAWEQEFDET
jgi:hypothetical protein